MRLLAMEALKKKTGEETVSREILMEIKHLKTYFYTDGGVARAGKNRA